MSLSRLSGANGHDHRQVVIQTASQQNDAVKRVDRLAALLSEALSRRLAHSQPKSTGTLDRPLDYLPTLPPTTDVKSTRRRDMRIEEV